MVNLRHPDNIFYDREGDLFIITTDLDGRQEVVCKTNLECVSDVLARLLDINFKKVLDSDDHLRMFGDLEQFACVYALKLMTYKTVKGLYLEFPTLAKYQGAALISANTIIDNRNDGYNNKYHLMLVNVIYTSMIHATVKYAGSSQDRQLHRIACQFSGTFQSYIHIRPRRAALPCRPRKPLPYRHSFSGGRGSAMPPCCTCARFAQWSGTPE